MAKLLPYLIFLFVFLYPQNVIAVPASYPPLPTGSQTGCVLDHQSPQASQKCADCLISNRPDIRQYYNDAQYIACNNVAVVNHWCNGGLDINGSNASADCNGVKNGVCSQSPDKACVNQSLISGKLPSLTPTPPATINTMDNPRGCGILYTSGIPSCWCNNGGGQGLCGKLPLDGPGGCRDLCERGVFVGPKGYTLCYMMTNNAECRSNDDGSYRFCEKRCLRGSPGFSQTVGCEYPNKTTFSNAKFDTGCILSFSQSSNLSFFGIIDAFFKGLARIVDVRNFSNSAVRVPGLQKADCNPKTEYCTFE